MTLKYESEIIKDIVESRGHEKSSLHYESECIEKWIEEAKGAYPKLCDYQSEWINYINENPLGNFPYEIITDVTEATVNNVVPYAYGSAILKGSTKYRDIDTGEFLETFEEGRNLELVSVKMLVLTTTGKNLINMNDYALTDGVSITQQNENSITFNAPYTWGGIQYRMQLNPNTKYTVSMDRGENTIVQLYVRLKNENGNYSGALGGGNKYSFTTNNTGFVLITIETSLPEQTNLHISNLQLEEGSTVTNYEPHKSNILMVNEDVTLRSNGSVHDELDLLTGKLTQRIDENGEVLSQEIVKTVALNIQDHDGNTLSKITPIEGTMHIHSDGTPLKPTITMEIPVEATTQNLASFIKEE